MEHRLKYTTPKGVPIWRAIGLWPGAHPVTMGFVPGKDEWVALNQARATWPQVPSWKLLDY